MPYRIFNPSTGEASAWERVLLADLSVTDPNALLVGSLTETAGDAGSTTLTIDADKDANARNNITAFLLYYETVSGVSWENLWSVSFMIEMVTDPGASTAFMMGTGVSSDITAAARSVGIGQGHNLANRDVITWQGSGTPNIISAVAVVHTFGDIVSTADKISSHTTNRGVDANFSGVATFRSETTQISPLNVTDNVVFWVGFGNFASASADYTVEFRLWRSPTIILNK